MNGNGSDNGRNHGFHSRQHRLFDDEEPLPAAPPSDVKCVVERAVQELRLEFSRLIVVVGNELASQRELATRIDGLFEVINRLAGRLQQLVEQVERVVLVLAQQNAGPSNGQFDDHVITPGVRIIAQIIDRQGREIRDAERSSNVISLIEAGRRCDMEELLHVLDLLDVEQISEKAGVKFDPTIHGVNDLIRSGDVKYAKVLRVVRPGYRRRRDGRLFRPILVDVVAPKKTQ